MNEDELHDQQPPENIWIASSDGDVGRVIQLLQEDPLMVNAQDEVGYSPL